MVNKPQPHPVGSFAERHPANTPHGDFSQQIPKATKTPGTRFCPEKGGVLRTSESKCQFIRKKAGFSGQTRGSGVSRADADCGLTDKLGLRFTDRRSLDFPDTCHLDFPDALHLNFPDTIYLTKRPKSGTTELPSQMARGGLTALGTRGRGPRAGGPGPPRVLPRRDVVNKPQLHPVGSFAERHPANSPLGDFSQQIPKATKTPATRFCPEKGGVFRTSESKYQFIRKKAGFHGQSEKNDDLKEHVLQIIIGNKQNQNVSTLD